MKGLFVALLIAASAVLGIAIIALLLFSWLSFDSRLTRRPNSATGKTANGKTKNAINASFQFL